MEYQIYRMSDTLLSNEWFNLNLNKRRVTSLNDISLMGFGTGADFGQ